MGKDAGAPPPAPDYKAAAESTAAGNRVSQYTPYGSLEYYQDPNATDSNQGWSAVTTLAPAQRQLLDQQNKTSLGLSALTDRGLGFVNDALSNQISLKSLPKSMVNPGQTGQDALMARFQPQIDQSRKELTTQLANQGIMPGSEAYANAMRTQTQSENDLRMQAALHGIDVGQNAQNQQLGLQTALQNQPLNILNAVRSGSQVTNPTFGTTPGGADYSSALKDQSSYNQGLYNSQVASANAGNAATMQGLGTAAMVGAMFF